MNSSPRQFFKVFDTTKELIFFTVLHFGLFTATLLWYIFYIVLFVAFVGYEITLFHLSIHFELRGFQAKESYLSEKAHSRSFRGLHCIIIETY